MKMSKKGGGISTLPFCPGKHCVVRNSSIDTVCQPSSFHPSHPIGPRLHHWHTDTVCTCTSYFQHHVDVGLKSCACVRIGVCSGGGVLKPKSISRKIHRRWQLMTRIHTRTLHDTYPLGLSRACYAGQSNVTTAAAPLPPISRARVCHPDSVFRF